MYELSSLGIFFKNYQNETLLSQLEMRQDVGLWVQLPTGHATL